MIGDPGGDGDTYARFSLKGEVSLRVTPDLEAMLSRVEARFGGSFGAIEPPFRLTLEAAIGEIRKMAAMSPAIETLLPLAAEHGDDAPGVVTLRAPPAHLAALREAARGTPDMDADALLHNEAWMTLCFKLSEYEGESIGTVERWIEPG